MNRILVDFSRRTGSIKPLHGINNGPVSNFGFVDTSAEYRAAGIPFVLPAGPGGHSPDFSGF